ncbi:MAG: rbsA 1 [Verrucomicrobiales bacterium]|nr:rbsA 1 [Verrucomicrobiales bacterium]
MSFIEFRNISKRFPGVQALDKVSFSIELGSCHALIGENGAGKSTIGKILAGVYTADSGEIWIEGKRVSPANPLEARTLGISMVHQELAFCPNLTIAENLCLGNLPRKWGWLDRKEMLRQAKALLGEIDCPLDPMLLMSMLTTGQEQMVQIAAALGSGSKVIVMDEPTSSLSAHESEALFHLIEKLRSRGLTLIYVSHRMEELFRLCDAITVLRDGQHVSTEPIKMTSQEKIIHQMVGREVLFKAPRHREESLGAKVLEVTNLKGRQFSGINFELREKEVLGFGGLVGAGRSELALALMGLDPEATGHITVEGKELKPKSIRSSMASGIGLVPEDRKRQGLVLSMNCRENASLAGLERFTHAGLVSDRQERECVEKYTSRLRVKTPSLETQVASLSGGNQQKIALAKWLVRDCKILIVDEPTRGVDVGAKAEIHELLDELACSGVAIIMISSELPELMNLSSRILIMRDGKLQGNLSHKEFSQNAIMRLMAGI